MNNYKMSVAPIEMSRHEMSLLNNPRTILCYRDKVNLNLDSYIQR